MLNKYYTKSLDGFSYCVLNCESTMVVPSIMAFFVLSHLLFLHSAGEDNTSFQNCPQSFQCGKLGQIKFPYSNITYPQCGLCTVNCGEAIPKLNFSVDQPWYEVHDKFLNHEVQNVTDKNLESLIKSKSCDVFTFYLRWSLPTTPSVSFTVSPNLTFFKCPTGVNGKLEKQIEHFFCHNHSYSYYKDCLGYTIYYKNPDDPPQSLLINERILQSCGHFQLPVFSLNDGKKRNASDLFSVLASEFSLGFHVSKECGKCNLTGGQCPRYNSSKFQCIEQAGLPKKNIEQAKHGTNHVKLILATVLPGGGVFLLCLLIVITWLRKEWNYNSSYISSRDNFSNRSLQADTEGCNVYFGVSVFSYTELNEATHNFDPTKELGDGGFGTVYHGKLQDGREVAVKRLYEHNYKRVRQFMNEIQILTSLSHPNLVTLYGCTSRLSRELLLVYEYIPNGTVADHLHGDRANAGSLTWPIRMNIAIETASALAYLHASDIIHRDIKTNNILLDNNFCVKVADFGLSRLFPNDVTHVSTAPQGTPGYVDPEYHQCYQLTDKSDVYSFGVVLVELISSMPAVDITRHKQDINLSNLAINRIQNRTLDELVDPTLGFKSDSSIERMITSVAEVAFRCLQLEKEMRPTMDEVLEALKDIKQYKNENTGEGIDNVGVSTSARSPSSPQSDNVVLLKKIKSLSSPDSVTNRWVSSSTTSISSG
ncbi:LEAF RUST 10 DISEASE-RESISTANCE LOCUS RECEPTOR-LIKE PROTEIN KINASE-like 1.1 isoform X1 [Camellia sinensis]|uniref:LEAF RUST 10 DISEASE-RESISTANCE LOCUS RECEPTOR-LIKE PROTEIN KINASE-like 1.1 isoform X1 n=1 Tax=Camellia sinensis TaxID=4442 RepID=UPI0010355671|nr:LEAF RUST 10 DISEASE-RESISTANCE LOCUS RECEPTOR-LIKE PROTEIN KINASE-like 1.1 isoform X1 [Camellia sinensis]